MEIKSESPIPRRLALSSPAPGSEASGSRLVTSTGTRFESAGPRTKSEPQSQLQDNSTVDLGATTNALIWSENIAVGDETVGSRRLSVSSDSSGTSVSGEQSSENGGEPSRGTVTEIPSCEEELQAVWQTLQVGYRGLESACLAISAMTITAQRAADKVKAQKLVLGTGGKHRTIAKFQAGRYLRRTQSLMRKVDKTMRMLLQEQPRLLGALCGEKKRLLRVAKIARTTTRKSSNH